MTTPAPVVESGFWTKGRARIGLRVGFIFCFAAFTFLLYGFAPEPQEESVDVVPPSLRAAPPKPLPMFPPLKAVLDPQLSLFNYRQAYQAAGKRAFQVAKPKVNEEPEVQAPPPPPPPPPAPDTSGLTLIAVHQFSDGAGMAMVKEGENTYTVAVGDTLRNSKVDRLEAGAMVLKLGEIEAKVEVSTPLGALVMKPFKVPMLPSKRPPPGVKKAPVAGEAPPPPTLDTQTVRKSLGISIKEVSLFDLNKMKSRPRSRVKVLTAVSGSGIKPGDMIVAINDTPVINARDTMAALEEARAKPEVEIRIWRDGSERDAKLTWKEIKEEPKE
jgi:hypothetical protein